MILVAVVIGLLVVVVGGVFLFWRSTIPATPSAFYTPPDPLPAGQPGMLIASEPLTSGVPDGATGWRVLYLSTGVDGEPVAVSGIVVTPTAPAEGPRPTLAFAHGTLGVRPECGTSHTGDPLGGIPEAARWLSEGFVIAATDYPGRGTPGVHPYLVGPVAAASVLDSVRVARALVPEADDRFAVWGRSQGGHTALWTGMTAADYAPELELLGVAPSAPAIDLPAILEHAMTTRAGAVVVSQALYAWSHVYSGVDLDDLVKPEQRTRFEQIATICLTTPNAFILAGLVGGVPTPTEFLAVDPLTTERFRALIDRNIPNGPIEVPVLISHGTGDTLIPFAGSEAEATRRCAAGEDVQFTRYPGVGHDASAESAIATIGWVEDRFAGRPTGPNCGT
jgi:alpha-beta hydrolase superfamily lysophospholipase